MPLDFRLRLRSSIQDHDGVRQQFNGLSSFLDAANVYGYNKQRALQVVRINAKEIITKENNFHMFKISLKIAFSFSSFVPFLMVCSKATRPGQRYPHVDSAEFNSKIKRADNPILG